MLNFIEAYKRLPSKHEVMGLRPTKGHWWC